MKIADLLNGTITEIIDFRGTKVFAEITPDVYYLADEIALDKNNADSLSEYIAKGLKRFGVMDGENKVDFTDEKKKKLEITPEILKTVVPESLLFQIINKIESLKLSTAGK